ncbi:hypothetical protein ES707_05100 [subsurface metagenome]
MASGESPKIAKLVDILMANLSEVADDDDWKESDGWVGKWTIYGESSITRIYAVKDGKFYPTGEHIEYTGQVEMSEDTFLDLVEGALHGRGEDVFAQKYAARAIRYRGDQWIVDSERFRKVLRRLSGIPLRSLR